MGTPWGEQEGRVGQESGVGVGLLSTAGSPTLQIAPCVPGHLAWHWADGPGPRPPRPWLPTISSYLCSSFGPPRHFCSFLALAPLFLPPNGWWDNPPHLKHLGGEERVPQTQHQRARSPEGLGACFCFQFLSLGPCTNLLGSWAPARLLGCQVGFWAHHRWGEKAAL